MKRRGCGQRSAEGKEIAEPVGGMGGDRGGDGRHQEEEEEEEEERQQEKMRVIIEGQEDGGRLG